MCFIALITSLLHDYLVLYLLFSRYDLLGVEKGYMMSLLCLDMFVNEGVVGLLVLSTVITILTLEFLVNRFGWTSQG